MPEGQPQVPWRFGVQLLPAIGRQGAEKVVCGLVDGRPVALTCRGLRWSFPSLGQVQVWDMGDHQELGRPIRLRNDEVPEGLAYGRLEGRDVVVVVDKALRVFDLAERRQISRGSVRAYPPDRRPAGGLRDVACTRLDDRLVAVTGGVDCNVRIWDVATGKQLGDPLRGHSGVITSVACGVLDGRPIAVTGSEDRTVRLWDLDRREQMGRPLCGHDDEVRAVTYGLANGRPVVASGSKDGVLRLWELDDPDPRGTTLFVSFGHLGINDSSRVEIDAVALARVAGKDMLVSGGEDVRLWDLRTRRQAGQPLFDGRDSYGVSSLSCGTLHGRPIALAAYHGGLVRVWDLEEHRRIGGNPPARWAAELPASWTDPATGDVYDLTRPLVSMHGTRWDVVDYDGIEPIVGERPLNPRVTFGIDDAHAEFGFGDAVTPAPRPRSRSVEHSTRRQYYEFRVLDDHRLLSGQKLAELIDQFAEDTSSYPKATFSPARMVWDFDPDDEEDEEEDWGPGLLLGGHQRDELLCSHFDAYLGFRADGARDLMFRIPAARLALKTVQPYLAHARLDGLSAQVRDSSLLLGFHHYEEDGELAHWRERPENWLKPLLPLRADLAEGDISAAYLGWLKAVQEDRDRDTLQPPPRPAALQEMSPQLKKLATLLHLNRWARKHLP